MEVMVVNRSSQLSLTANLLGRLCGLGSQVFSSITTSPGAVVMERCGRSGVKQKLGKIWSSRERRVDPQ